MLESKAKPSGELKVVVEVFGLLPKNPLCPKTAVAAWPLLMLEVLKTSTRLFAVSETNKRLLAESKATPLGPDIPVDVVVAINEFKSACPKTFAAVLLEILLLPSKLKTKTRLLFWSATNNRLPLESSAVSNGLLNPWSFGPLFGPDAV